LKDFECTFLLPQQASVSVGCYGDTKQSNMCKDDELFTMTTKTIVACRRGEKYDASLNFAFEYSPCNEKNESNPHNYNTIQELLAGNKEILPVKPYKGKLESL